MGQHGLPVTHASFFPSKSTSLAVTMDRRGRVVAHVLSNNMLLLRTTVTSRWVRALARSGREHRKACSLPVWTWHTSATWAMRPSVMLSLGYSPCRPALDGSLGVISNVVHLTPFQAAFPMLGSVAKVSGG